MKNISILLTGLSLIMYFGAASAQSWSGNPENAPAIQSGTNAVKVSSSPELYQLALIWADNFSQSNPTVKVNLDQINGNANQSADYLRLVTDQNTGILTDQSLWKMVIGRDVIVPVVNANNPMLNLLYKQGISRERFSLLFNDPSERNWSSILIQGQNVQMQFIFPDNNGIISGLEEFTKTTVSASNGELVSNAGEVLAAVQKNVFAIGFCTLNDLKTFTGISGNETVRLLPIDKNGNGRMDNFENIYRNTDEFTHGVWIGKYPAALCKSIYAVAPVKPSGQSELLFLAWILAEGQSLLNTNGYCELAGSEKQANTTFLLSTRPADIGSVSTASFPQSWTIFLTVLLLVVLFVALYEYSRRGVKKLAQEPEIQVAPFLIEHAMDVPKGLWFDKTHTWAFMEQDGNVRVGIDDFLQHITGKLTKIRMKEAGEMVRKGETIMTIIRDGKQLNLYAPISGTILEHNEFLLSDAAIINYSPFFKGWIYQIEPTNWLRETQFMLMGERYADWLRDEFVRFKDFIAASVRTDNNVYAHVVLQDGGELTDNVLADLGPEVWEDFQTRFIDTSR